MIAGSERRRERIARRQARLVELARDIATSAGKDLDDNDARELLRTIVRRWSTTEAPAYWSRAATRARVRGEAVHVEHVVPVRVLVDRMIAKPRSIERLLRRCILLAEITPAEHTRIGTLLRDHSDLYAELKTCRLDELCTLSWGRYTGRVRVYDAEGAEA